MTVPNCKEWQVQPGFETCDCHCVRVCKKPWPDCTACAGTGVIGLVPGTVWDAARRNRPMPSLKGDPRFDPRVVWVRNVEEFEKRVAEEQQGRIQRVKALAGLLLTIFAGLALGEFLLFLSGR